MNILRTFWVVLFSSLSVLGSQLPSHVKHHELNPDGTCDVTFVDSSYDREIRPLNCPVCSGSKATSGQAVGARNTALVAKSKEVTP